VAVGRTIVLAWLDYPEAEGARVMTSSSSDGGTSWTSPRALFDTSGESDEPQLAVRGTDVYLSWFTDKEGLRLAAAAEKTGG
jgi:hypothetical protein